MTLIELARALLNAVEALPTDQQSHPVTIPRDERLVEIGRASGVVLWFNDSKGFGYIKPDEGGAELFAHFSQIQAEGAYKTLREGARVEFNVSAGPKGKQATHIKEIKS